MMRLKMRLIWCKRRPLEWKPFTVRWKDSQRVSWWCRELWCQEGMTEDEEDGETKEGKVVI